MKINWKRTLGVVTVVGATGFVIYAVRAHKKRIKEEEQALTADEIIAEFEGRKAEDDEESEENSDVSDDTDGGEIPSEKPIRIVQKIVEVNEGSEDFDSEIDDIRDTAGWNRSFMTELDGHRTVTFSPDMDEIEVDGKIYDIVDGKIDVDSGRDVEEEIEEEVVDELSMYDLSEDKREGEDVNHHPDSDEALYQYIGMEIADWGPAEDTHHILLALSEFPFKPTNDGDKDLFDKISDYRAEFFGPNSKWTNQVSYMDVILYFARLAHFNVNESVSYWVKYFLEFNEFERNMSSRKTDVLLEALNNHIYFNENSETYGLFGLTQEGMANAIMTANHNIDTQVTYEIEFNEFLKMCIYNV